MKTQFYILTIILGLFTAPHYGQQIDTNKQQDNAQDVLEESFEELFYEALKQKGTENYQRSVDALLKCVELDKTVPVLYFELGKNYNKLKNFGAAEDAFKEAINKDPENVWFKDALYNFYVKQKEQDQAIKVVKELVKLRPKYKEQLATLYYKTKAYDDALILLDELDATYGVSYKRDTTRRRIYNATGRKQDQIKNLENRVDNNPKKESNYLALIYNYSTNNQKDKAFKTAKELLKVNPKSELVHLALYKFYLDKGSVNQAIQSMKIVTKSNQVKDQAKQKVIQDFVAFVAKNPEYENELIQATKLVKNNNDGKTLLELGQYYYKKKDYKEALKYFEEATKLEAENFIVTKHILMLHLKLNQYKKAEEKSSSAIDKYPAQPLCYLINGEALNGLNKPQKAINVLESGQDWIVDNNAVTIEFYKQFSKAYTLLNNTVKAQEYNNKIKQLETN